MPVIFDFQLSHLNPTFVPYQSRVFLFVLRQSCICPGLSCICLGLSCISPASVLFVLCLFRLVLCHPCNLLIAQSHYRVWPVFPSRWNNKVYCIYVDDNESKHNPQQLCATCLRKQWLPTHNKQKSEQVCTPEPCKKDKKPSSISNDHLNSEKLQLYFLQQQQQHIAILNMYALWLFH